MSGRPSLLAVAVGAIAVAAVAVSLYVALAEQTEATSGTSTYSHSALGHSVLLDVLARRGVDAKASRGASRETLHGDGLLVLAEPDFDSSGEALRGLLRARHVLLVLPKWVQVGAADRRGWIETATLKPLSLVEVPLDDALPRARAVRTETPRVLSATPAWTGTAMAHLDVPAQLVTAGDPGRYRPASGRLGPERPVAGLPSARLPPSRPPPPDRPPPDRPAADFAAIGLMVPGRLVPAIASQDGVLLGYVTRGRGTLWVLADPDVISNHGMASGNAALAVAIIDRAREGGPVLFDETIHGFSSVPSGQFRLLAARPFAAATLDAILAVGLLVWAAGRRFGTDGRRPDAIAAGRLSLVRSVAGLMVFAGHLGDLARRYVAVSVEDVAARLHAPDTGQTEARAAWLAQAEQQRGMAESEAALRREADSLASVRGQQGGSARAIFALAQRTYRYKQEMLGGS